MVFYPIFNHFYQFGSYALFTFKEFVRNQLIHELEEILLPPIFLGLHRKYFINAFF